MTDVVSTDARRRPPSERLYNAVRTAILRGDVAPGQALKPQQLAAGEGVSLAVARESLLRLVGEGLAVRMPNRGFAVPAMDAERWQQIMEARIAVEPAILRLSIAHGDVDWEVRMHAAHYRLTRTPIRSQESTYYSEEWSKAHREFHRALLDGCGNAPLLDTFDRMWTASELARHWAGSAVPTRDAAREHAELEATALARDVGCAADLLVGHLTLTAESLHTAKQTKGRRA